MTPLILLGILTALILLAWAVNRNAHNIPKPKGKQVTDTIFDQWRRRQKLNVTAQKLMSDYVNNPYGADRTYTRTSTSSTSKVITVTGTIRSISRTESEDYINQFKYLIKLDGGVVDDRQTEVFCNFDRSHSGTLRHLKKGDTVKITGYVQTGTHNDIDGTKKRGGLRRYVRELELERVFLKKALENPEAVKKIGTRFERTIYYVVMDGCRLVK